MNVRADRVFTELLVEFWDPAKEVFKLVDSEVTPTLEEITNFTELPFTRRMPILLVTMPGHRFLYALGLNNNRNLRNVEEGWISMDQLFEKFGYLESYELLHHEEFLCNRETWESLHPLAFSLALLGLLVFPQWGRGGGGGQCQRVALDFSHISHKLEIHPHPDVTSENV